MESWNKSHRTQKTRFLKILLPAVWSAWTEACVQAFHKLNWKPVNSIFSNYLFSLSSLPQNIDLTTWHPVCFGKKTSLWKMTWLVLDLLCKSVLITPTEKVFMDHSAQILQTSSFYLRIAFSRNHWVPVLTDFGISHILAIQLTWHNLKACIEDFKKVQ